MDGAVASNDVGPIAKRDRIDVLDILRGLAILLIFLMNIPAMGQLFEGHPSIAGWTPADQVAWAVQSLFFEGTQRGLLQVLFGAGLMITAARAMTPDGPVGIADAFQRRNLWLVVFGLAHAFLFLWFGEILFIYGLAALFIFPLRKLSARTLFIGAAIPLVLIFLIPTLGQMQSRTELLEKAPAALAARDAKKPLTDAQKATLKQWDQLQEGRHGTGKIADEARAAHKPGSSFGTYYAWATGIWLRWGEELPPYIAEAALTMLMGMALYKWGVVQGARSTRFYAVLMLGCYAAGLALRAWAVRDTLSMTLEPKASWLFYEPGRILMTIGHLALVNLLVSNGFGRLLLQPFVAVGRVPLTVYFGQSIIGMWILFAPFGLGLWGQFGRAGLAGIAFAVMALQVVGANIMLRYLENGPFEWLWKSLTYVKAQPFLKRRPTPPALAMV